MIFLYDFRRDVPAPKNVDFGIGSSFRAMLFYCREVFRRRSPAVAVRAAAAVQQLAASQQLLTALNKVEIRRKNLYFCRNCKISEGSFTAGRCLAG